MSRLGALVLSALLGVAPSLHAGECPEPGKQLFWGDLHVHTAYSMVAYVLITRATPEDAYAFARGASVAKAGGGSFALERPLDFAAVTDHAEYFGLMSVCRAQPGLPYCAELAEAAEERSPRGFMQYFLPILLSGDRNCQVDAAACGRAEHDLWQAVIRAAQDANRPCEFTAFIGNEWTASPDNLHWHRNLIYAGSRVPDAAISSLDHPTQEDLWRALDAQCADQQDCDVLAIPHNSNLSMGGSFATRGHTAVEQRLRARFEKLVEMHQHKGASECFPGSTYADEACGFEIALPIPLRNALRAEPRSISNAEQDQIASGYVRPTLAAGLSAFAHGGINPFQYGFVGGTDNHSARPGSVEEPNWTGSFGQWDDTVAGRQTFPEFNPGGLTAVWAEENTRAALFEALTRRETYATSGPRIRLRFDQTAMVPETCGVLPAGAVPMGGELKASGANPPVFTVQALRDRVPLARIDLIKLVMRNGAVEQTLHAFPASPEDETDWCIAWRDDSYSPHEPALWYVRVLEQPTMRWDGARLIRERAWSSPIWRLPSAG